MEMVGRGKEMDYNINWVNRSKPNRFAGIREFGDKVKLKNPPLCVP
jgi:hypothetical protein